MSRTVRAYKKAIVPITMELQFYHQDSEDWPGSIVVGEYVNVEIARQSHGHHVLGQPGDPAVQFFRDKESEVDVLDTCGQEPLCMTIDGRQPFSIWLDPPVSMSKYLQARQFARQGKCVGSAHMALAYAPLGRIHKRLDTARPRALHALHVHLQQRRPVVIRPFSSVVECGIIWGNQIKEIKGDPVAIGGPPCVQDRKELLECARGSRLVCHSRLFRVVSQGPVSPYSDFRKHDDVVYPAKRGTAVWCRGHDAFEVVELCALDVQVREEQGLNGGLKERRDGGDR